MTIFYAFAVLGAAALAGFVLALPYLKGPNGRLPNPILGAIHGVLGGAGLGLLLATVRRGVPQSAMGTQGFARTGATLLALALALGLHFAWSRYRGRRPAGTLVGAHAGLAIAAIVVLLALIALR